MLSLHILNVTIHIIDAQWLLMKYDCYILYMIEELQFFPLKKGFVFVLFKIKLNHNPNDKDVVLGLQ